MLLDQISLLTAGGALALGLFFVSQLWRRPKGGADRELGLLILVCAANAAHPALTRLFHLPMTSGQFFEPMEFLLPPLLWIYGAAAVRGGYSWKPATALHFVPFVLAVICSALFTLGDREPLTVSVVFWAVLSLQMVAYLAPALRLFHRYQNGLTDRVSNLAADLGWLRLFYWVAVGLCLTSFGVLITLLHGAQPILGLAVTVALAASVAVLGTRGLEQKMAPAIEAAERPPLPGGEAKRLAAELQVLFSTRKPHLDPDLDLAQLARLTGVARNSLSYVINTELGMNFYDLVNGWRLREFRLLAADASRQDDKLLTLAFDSGFNSKPTFNKVVLKLTGKTPSQVRQEIVSQPSR